MMGSTGQSNDSLEANDREDDEDDEDQKCAICFEVPKTFGLLVSCNHAFCLACIRTWRSKETAADLQPHDSSNVSVTKACPNCRTPSLYVVPSSFFPACPEQKEIIIQNYKEATSRKTCKYFAESGDRHWCPFGDGCFFAHLDENGEHCKVNPESSPRRQRQRRIERRNRFGNRNVYDAIAQMRQGVLETMRASHPDSTEEELAGFETLLVELSSRLSSLNFDQTDFDYNFWDEIPPTRNVVFDDDFGGEWYETDGEDDDAEGDDQDDYGSDYGYHYHYDYDDPDVLYDLEFNNNRSANRARRR
ncbi:hypothetical protein BGX21_002064 [Mortierella sp. AD011]|nr:hypothetical protein BGX20_009190 [Mortierella sp. AD010]KAF9381568.1 hypothetical protein BGX21_002064 [Mortierella sp. AD011]